MPESVSRRTLLGAASAFSIIRPELVRGSQRNSSVRMALLGCGGRGTGVASGFTADTSAQYTALADRFQEQTERTQKTLGQAGAKSGKAAVPSGNLFYGPDCVEKLLASKDVDVVHIATPPYFHPAHFEAAVDAGRHVYVEKPVAVDVPGVKRVMRSGEKAGSRQSVTVGFQLRHATPYVQLVERVHNGDLGRIVTGLSHYYAGAIAPRDLPNASPVERRLRNWVHDRVLSGDILVEQNIHLIDVNNWVLKALPLSAQGTGGRAGRRDNGDCFSHFNITYTYPNDIHITLTSTQFIQGAWDVAMRYFGTASNAEMHYDAPVRITGENKWEFPLGSAPGATTKGALDDADRMKQRHFIESISSGRYINEVRQGAESTLTAMLGRQAAYSGRSMSWDELLRSDEVWDAKFDVKKL
jgi:myo-inositol 2-dehydrogenase / D-chiro-inositol 1-dehydrogenase